MRRIIVNADDFGLTAGVNRGISEASLRGILTSTSLIANGPGFDEAVRLAIKHFDSKQPRVSIGCHIVLLDGQPLLEDHAIQTLIGSRHARYFRPNFTEFGLTALRGSLSPAEIEAEATAQIRKIQLAGISVSHVDTHKHAHLFPAVMKPIIRAAKACGVRAIRNPFYTNKFPGINAVAQRPRLAKRYLQIPLLRRFAAEFQRLVRLEGISTTDGCIGVYEPALLDLITLHKVICRVPPGTWELVCHPGYVDAELNNIKTRLRESRTDELNLLTSDGIREIFSTQHISTISYFDL